MRKNLWQFYKESLNNFFEAVMNLIVFFPYFFSITSLLRTLFSPWKNLIAKKTTRGFSFSEWLNRAGFNTVSSLIGLTMRLSIITFYFLIQILFLILLLPVFIGHFILIPALYFAYCINPTETETKSKLKNKFISSHLLNQENFPTVEKWFEFYYQNLYHKALWWKIPNLFSNPPLARDWSVGYTPILDDYVEDLTSSIYQAKIKNIVDREKEINEIERNLSKSSESNVVIVGEEGVGKHTIVDALAKKIYEGKINSLLMYKRVLKLNMEKILTKFTDQKQREFFLEELFKEAIDAKNIILLIDDLDKYISLGPDRIDLTAPIEKFAKTAFIQIIGITTPFFYQKFVFNNGKINRIFNKIDVYEVTKNEAEKILLQNTFIFEKRYTVDIPFETIKNTIEKSDYYITYIPFPEKALELLDSACVYVKQIDKATQVMPDIVDKILSEKTHIPTTLSEPMKQKLTNMENLLLAKIIQQNEAIKKLSSSLRRSFVLSGKRKKPLSTFLFLGPTGVGKTETAKTISRVFFGSEKYLVRFDMSMYQSKEDIPNLVGSIDSGNPGFLTKALRENPYGVLLLDEIEKADKDLLNIFLTILDEGYFTDGFGRRVDCKNLVIIATSNAGVDILYNRPTNSTSLESELINYLVTQHIFSPEFLNRFDGVILYNSLNQQSIAEIAKRMIINIAENIYKLYKVHLNITQVFFDSIVQKGYDPRFGARNMDRVIRDEIEDRVAKLILEKKAKAGDTINL